MSQVILDGRAMERDLLTRRALQAARGLDAHGFGARDAHARGALELHVERICVVLIQPSRDAVRRLGRVCALCARRLDRRTRKRDVRSGAHKEEESAWSEHRGRPDSPTPFAERASGRLFAAREERWPSL